MSALTLSVLPGEYTVHRLAPNAPMPPDVFSAIRTPGELSIVALTTQHVASERREGPFRCLKVEGPLDFALTGILASIAVPLAAAKISIFALSTFDTDYVLVKSESLAAAKVALLSQGFKF